MEDISDYQERDACRVQLPGVIWRVFQPLKRHVCFASSRSQDRFHVHNEERDTMELRSLSYKIFRDKLFRPFAARARSAILQLIQQERQGSALVFFFVFCCAVWLHA